jgi:hypothetical protein
MTDYEKRAFERTWILIETNKVKLEQEKRRAMERDRRVRKDLSEKARKQRTHRLIERGAITEKFLPESFANDDLMNIFKEIFALEEVKSIVDSYDYKGSFLTGTVPDDDNEPGNYTVSTEEFF